MIEIKKIHELACFEQATTGSVGFDVCTTEDIILTGEVPYAAVPTGICLNMVNTNVWAMLTARSSLFKNTGCVLANGVGVIDQDYLGEIKVPLLYRPESGSPFNGAMIRAGTQIAQIVFVPRAELNIQSVTSFTTVTERNDGSFGSTDKLIGKILC